MSDWGGKGSKAMADISLLVLRALYAVSVSVSVRASASSTPEAMEMAPFATFHFPHNLIGFWGAISRQSWTFISSYTLSIMHASFFLINHQITYPIVSQDRRGQGHVSNLFFNSIWQEF